jgi:hypothetical protein
MRRPSRRSVVPPWQAMLEAEPRLRELIAEAELIGSSDWHDYEQFKRRLSKLVGWFADKPELRTCEAYSLGIDMIVEALKL